MSYKLGVLLTHPVQYYSPWFSYLADRLELEVFYAHKQDSAGQSKAGFGVDFEWDIPLLEGYKYTWLKNISANPGPGSFFGCDTPEIFDKIKKRKFDAFLIFGWGYKSAVQAVYACWRNKIPVLHRGDSNLLTPRSKIIQIIKYLPYSFLLPKLDAHLYVGNLNKEYLRHYGVKDNQLFYCPHFIDNEHFREKSQINKLNSTDKIKNKYNIPLDAFVLLFVGKFINVKRPLDLIDAAKEILNSKDIPELHVLFVGDGPLMNRMIKGSAEYENNFHYAGFVNQSDIAEYYAASDCLVLPSQSETWGLVVNEAMLCGLPVIASQNVGSAYDMIEDGYTGFVFKTGDTDSLQTAIKKICLLSRENKKDIQNNLFIKSEHYSMKNATKGLIMALEYLC